MIVAVIAVGVMQVSLDQVVDVIAVGHRLVATVGAVFVLDLVILSCGLGRAAVRVLVADGDPMLVEVIVVRMMEMAIVQIVRVPVVADCDMSTVRAVLVLVVGVRGVIALWHRGSFTRVAYRTRLVRSASHT